MLFALISDQQNRSHDPQADSEDDVIVNKRGLSAELRGALIEAKESIEGKRKLNTLDNLIVELKKGSKL